LQLGYKHAALVCALTELAPSLKKSEKELESVVLPRLALYATPPLDLLPSFLRVLEQTDTPTQVTRCVQPNPNRSEECSLLHAPFSTLQRVLEQHTPKRREGACVACR
jgi:hypothetical protein